jgi:hypothetical protein
MQRTQPFGRLRQMESATRAVKAKKVLFEKCYRLLVERGAISLSKRTKTGGYFRAWFGKCEQRAYIPTRWRLSTKMDC